MDLRSAIEASERRKRGEPRWPGGLSEHEISTIYHKAHPEWTKMMADLASRHDVTDDEAVYVVAMAASIQTAIHVRGAYYVPMLERMLRDVGTIKSSLDESHKITDELIETCRKQVERIDELEDAINAAYREALCGPEVGNEKSPDERLREIGRILGKHQTEIG